MYSSYVMDGAIKKQFLSFCCGKKLLFLCILQYSQRHNMIYIITCITVIDIQGITHLSDLDISFVLLNISSKFLLHLECYLQMYYHPKSISE